jgi:hypothetical protein
MPVAKPRNPLVLAGRVVDGGILHLDNRAQLDRALKHPSWQRRVTITIAPEEERRRQRANKYYWGVVLKMMAEECGHTADDLHELMKLRHNSKLVVEPLTGEEVKIAQSTAKLTIPEFSVYLERVMLDGSEWLGIVFPEPSKHEEWRQDRAAA